MTLTKYERKCLQDVAIGGMDWYDAIRVSGTFKDLHSMGLLALGLRITDPNIRGVHEALFGAAIKAAAVAMNGDEPDWRTALESLKEADVIRNRLDSEQYVVTDLGLAALAEKD